MGKVKVLHVVSSLKTGGVEKLLYDVSKYIDKSRYEFKFITHNNPGVVENLLVKDNIVVHHIVNRRKHPVLSAFQFYKFLAQNRFDVIHFHGNFEVLLEFIAAKLSGNSKLVIHSHNYKKHMSILLKFIMYVTQKIFTNFAQMCVGCSDGAGFFGFGKIEQLNNYITIYNGIEIGKYKFNENKRCLLREKLNIENDEFVIGTIGRLTNQKNFLYLLRIIAFMKNTHKLKVLIVGEGEDEDLLKSFIDDNDLREIVVFLGVINNVPDFLSCIDLFVLTSKYEGFPIVGIEAQASGVDCIFSDEITREIKIVENVKFLPIDEISIEKWVKAIEAHIEDKNFKVRVSEIDVKLRKSFDIRCTTLKLTDVYRKLISRDG